LRVRKPPAAPERATATIRARRAGVDAKDTIVVCSSRIVMIDGAKLREYCERLGWSQRN
jgi:hypothetical protein